MKAGDKRTVERMVRLGRVTRSGFYRFEDAEPGPDMRLRHANQNIAVEWPSHRRPLVARGRRERGWKVNAKRVFRLMREDNLPCIRKRKFVVSTDSKHNHEAHPNRRATWV